MKWTEEQKKVITLRDRNILVSAAAGSGKTATLVERILTWLCREENPGEIDRLLVLTFTKAAAAEMRERIGKAIEERLLEEPENLHLQRQSTLVHNAQITTIHSFCLYVVRNYFHLLSIDPGFRMGDEGEMKLLKKDVLRDLIEAYYQEGRPEFLAFVEAYATGKKDEVLEELILGLAEFSLGYPYPIRWLRDCRVVELEGSGYLQLLMDVARQTLFSVREQLLGARDICSSPQGPYLYEETIGKDLLLIDELLTCDSYEAYRIALDKPGFAQLSRKRMGEEVSEEKKEQVKAIRDTMKKCLKDLKEKYFSQTLDEALEYLEKASTATGMLLELAEQYLEKFAEKKRSKNLVDFSDLEHLALEILVQDVVTEEDGTLTVVPTQAAMELSEYLEEIMIDEYQDSNLLQEVLLTSVSRIRKGTPNVFMVGDVKQSIYSFRLARPELFLEKYKSYSLEDGLYQRIDLHQNFRSRREILEGANGIFRKIMTPLVGGITYDADAALYLGASYPEGKPAWNQSEVLLLETQDLGEATREKGDDGEQTPRELEAAMIGDKIKSLMEEMQVWDGKKNEYRPLEYGDIVILLRSLSGWGDAFARVLTEQGIPAYTESRTGYFDTVEIKTILHLLRVVDNPCQDIPLAAVMKSMIGGFTDRELASIRSAYGEMRFYRACFEYRENTEDPELASRLGAFFEMLERYRFKAQYMSIHEFISYMLEDTGYGDYLAVQPGGEQRSANVRMLVERAIAFESTSYRGLFHFVRYMEQLENYQEDMGEASVSGEGAHAVRIMSIHKSKGLEFPVVFVAGMGKSFNYQDSRSKVVLHPELGVGVDYVDSDRRVKIPTLPKKAIQKQRELEMLGEELRILYVALTRAKEKLILTGAGKDLDKKLVQAETGSLRDTLNYLELTKARTYLDWILPAVWGEEQFAISCVKPENLVLSSLEEQIQEEGRRETLEQLHTTENSGSHLTRILNRNLEYSYPFANEVQLQAKVSVSELKRAGQIEEEELELQLFKEPEIIPYVPGFMREEEPLSGAARGTAYHRVLQELDFEEMTHTDRVKEALERLVEAGKITEEMAASVRPWDIFAFCRTDLARRMMSARKRSQLYVEQPFVISLPACEIRKEWESREPVLIQGIIDAWFYEDDKIVIMDYKTDRVTYGEELAERYGVQLDYYEKALNQITGKEVKEKVIYSFCLGEMVKIPIK